MARTGLRGITIDGRGRRTIDKEHRGERIFARLGAVSQDEAERHLAKEIERLEWELERRIHARPLFSDCARRFLRESKHKRSATTLTWHVELLLRYVGDLEVHRVHDDTLGPFVAARLAGGVSATTVNRSLEVVRTILHRAARAYRDNDGMPWLEFAPPLITMLPEDPRPPYPISWDEQERIFRRLPGHLAHMALFAVSTGLRDSNLCGLRWSWEVPIVQLGRSVFVIPREAFKSRRPHVVILNDAAWSIVESRRGQHADWVFTFRGKPVQTMNNTAWQRARRKAGLPGVRIHDLRHTFATRLRAAGVHEEDRAALLGHAWRSMPEHYASADVRRLIDLANRVLDRSMEAVTILRVANGCGPSQRRRAELTLCG
jgi:integrase